MPFPVTVAEELKIGVPEQDGLIGPNRVNVMLPDGAKPRLSATAS